MLDYVLHDGSKSDALVVVRLYLLLELLGAGALDVLTEHFELLVALQNLVLELSDLLFQRHHEECLLLVLLGGLGKR